MEEKDPIINCHTHIFTGDHVPPLLARTYVPEPFHLLIRLSFIVRIFRWWYKGPATIPFAVWYKKSVRILTYIRAFFTRLYPFNVLAGYYIFLVAFYWLYKFIEQLPFVKQTNLLKRIDGLLRHVEFLIPDVQPLWIRILVVSLVLLFFQSIRNLILFAIDLIWKVMKALPGKDTKEMFHRYLSIGRYAFHQRQRTILSKLKAQYPAKTQFIILPMDMEFMAAGRCKKRYRDQMQELQQIKSRSKDLIHPFVFADPRRIVPLAKEKRVEPTDKIYFDWTVDDNGEVTLKDCFINDYLNEHQFSGIKIYPALGYYPFDAKLLPLWKYCAQKGIPIMTHCIRGTIFYRGLKKYEWNAHPVFRHAMERNEPDLDTDGFVTTKTLEKEGSVTNYAPLVLPQISNVDFSYNFTHPLNYLCLLEEQLLRKVITHAIADDGVVRKEDLMRLFGYSGPDAPMSRGLKGLKICLAHFGGEDEWRRYFELDRYNYSSQLIKNPKKGIDFFKTVDGNDSPGKLEQLWKGTDWYSIICSMMLQYPNVYADISYILHGNADIQPLLKQTLKNPDLKKKVLYGTDFFVVRNHKSDKNMLADWMGGLETPDFDQIARVNPKKFLEFAP